MDAGGRGLSVILDAAETVLTGRRPMPSTMPARRVPVLPSSAAHAADLVEGGPSYEVMYLLDAEDDRIPVLKKTLGGLGDSLVVVGNEGLWNVHVHVDDVGAAIEAGIEAGRPHRVRVTHFAEQARERIEPDAGERTGRRIVTVAAGPGAAAVFAEAGAVVVEGGPGRRPPSTGQLLEAITSCGAAEVVILPNDADSVRVAQIAARTATEDEGLHVAVIPTQAQVQGLAALAVHEPGRSFEQDVLEMTATARPARGGHHRREAGHHDGRPVRAGRRARRDRGRLRRGRRGPVRGRHRGPRPAARRWRRAGHDRGRRSSDEPRPRPTWPGAAPGGWRSTTRMSTSWCTTVGRSATRCSCPSNEPGAAMISLDSPVATVLGDHPAKRKKITEGLGLRTVGDLLNHFPRRYVKTGELTKVSSSSRARCSR